MDPKPDAQPTRMKERKWKKEKCAAGVCRRTRLVSPRLCEWNLIHGKIYFRRSKMWLGLGGSPSSREPTLSTSQFPEGVILFPSCCGLVAIPCPCRNVIDFRLGGDPRLLLRAINPGEAALFDRAAGVHLRFRLGGYTFPPSIYYKVLFGARCCRCRCRCRCRCSTTAPSLVRRCAWSAVVYRFGGFS